MKDVGKRWMRDPESGKGGYVPRDMTYQEWKEIYVDKTSTMEAWEAKHVDKSGKSGIIKTDEMAATDKILWPKKGEELTGDQRRELVDYANQKGIVLKGLRGSDVDPDLIKEAIDDAEMMISRIPVLNDNPQRPFTIKVVNGLDSNTFAQTNRYTSTNVTQLNVNAFRSKAALEKEYAKLVKENWFPQGTTYRSIIPHEVGHMYTQKFRIDGFSTAKSVLLNMYGNEYNIDEVSAFLRKNLSEYASTEKDHLCEMVAESFNAHFSNAANNSFADNVVKYLLGGE